MTPRFLSIFLSLLTVFSLYGAPGKYDELLRMSSGWTSEHVIGTADSFVADGREEEAMVLYMVVASRESEGADVKELRNQVKANLSAGDIHYGKGNYSYALRYYVTALKLSEATEGHPYLAVLYKNMGNVYNMFQDFEKGKSLYLSGLEEARWVKDSETAYKLLQNLVGVCISLGDVAGAQRYYEESRGEAHVETDESVYMDSYIPALLSRHEGRYGESIAKFKELARQSSIRKLPARYECSAYGEIGRIYSDLGNQDSAMYYLTRCKDVAQANGILYQYTESLKMLYSLYDSQGNHAKASELKDRYLELKDSIYNQRQFDMAKNQQFLYEMEKTEREIAELNEEKVRNAMLVSRQRVVLWSVLGATALAMFLLFYFYRQKRRLGDSYRKLYDVHQSMLSEHREHREKYMVLAQENVSLREELERLSGMPSAPAEEPVCEDDGEPQDPRYERSALSRSQKDRMANDISGVMERDKPFCSPDFSLNTLAALIGSNSKYVSQVINEVFKKNFSTFVNEHRINLACERLADTEGFGQYSMNGIGESVGFRAGATFTTVFKKITGITPSVYQKLTRENRNKAAKQGKELVIHES